MQYKDKCTTAGPGCMGCKCRKGEAGERGEGEGEPHIVKRGQVGVVVKWDIRMGPTCSILAPHRHEIDAHSYLKRTGYFFLPFFDT